MPAAIKTFSSLTTSPAITQTSITAALKNALTNAGFPATPFDEFTDGANIQYLVYQITNDAIKTKGIIYYQLAVSTTFSITQKLFLSWNATTHVGTTESTFAASVVLSTASQIDFTSFSHPEFKGTLIQQAANNILIGYLRPSSKPSWWDENTFAYGFIAVSGGLFATFHSFNGTQSPYNFNTSAANSYSIFSDTRLSNINPITNRRDIIPAAYLLTPTSVSAGISGRLSDDFVITASTGIGVLDSLQLSETEEYTLFNPAASGVAIRTI